VKPARLRTTVIVAVVVGIAAWAVLDARDANGDAAPPIPWTAAVAVAMSAIAVLVLALDVRRWVTGRRERPMDPIFAARVGVLAQAAAYAGAALTGWYLAQAVVVIPDVVGDRRTRLILGLVSAAVSAGLVASGLVAQRWCRRPPDDQDDTTPADVD
jgi:signal transduction histidine kinase